MSKRGESALQRGAVARSRRHEPAGHRHGAGVQASQRVVRVRCVERGAWCARRWGAGEVSQILAARKDGCRSEERAGSAAAAREPSSARGDQGRAAGAVRAARREAASRQRGQAGVEGGGRGGGGAGRQAEDGQRRAR